MANADVNASASPLAYRSAQAAVVLGVSLRTLQALTAAGDVPHCRIGRSVLYPRAELVAWLSAKTRDTIGGDA